MMIAEIVSLDYEGRGVARMAGKTVFVRNALPGERVRVRLTQQHARFDEAETVEVLQASSNRIRPPCPHYGECGGCSLQHADFAAQVAYKQRVFEEQLQRIGQVRPEILLPPLYGAPWHYRSRARLAVAADGNGGVHLGFQAAKSRRVVALRQCDVLPAWISGSLKDWAAEINRLHRAAPACGIEAVEISVGQTAAAVKLVSRKPLPAALLHDWAQRLNRRNPPLPWQVWQQSGRQSAQAVAPEPLPPLFYTLPEFGLTMPFQPGDFTQINTALNESMVSRAVRLLDPQPQERIADLFCGLGNFTLPLARSGAQVLGIEGDAALTARAQANARANGIENVRFRTADLFAADAATVAAWGRFDKMLLDPPRAGAYEVVKALQSPYLPQRLVYVSCNPATFARDAAVLTDKGYRFQAAGIMNLFAQTAHIEAIGLFTLTS